VFEESIDGYQAVVEVGVIGGKRVWFGLLERVTLGLGWMMML
jgi:hypothetical protein